MAPEILKRCGACDQYDQSQTTDEIHRLRDENMQLRHMLAALTGIHHVCISTIREALEVKITK